MSEELKPLRVYITKDLGRYNWAGNEKSWSVAVLMPDGKVVSATWDEDDEPGTDGLPPSEVIDLIVEQIKSYWITPSRDATLARIDSFRSMLPKMDDAWARSQIAMYERRITGLQCHLLEDEVAE